MDENQTDKQTMPSLADLLSIWPIAESVARQLPVSDLITLARSTSDLRASLHGMTLEHRKDEDMPRDSGRDILCPQIGEHQTRYWKSLKSISPFTCGSKTHTRGENIHACLYCSKPICEACIVRDSFKRRNENTFRNRYRLFCQRCWVENRPTKNFRYVPDPPSYEEDSTQASGDGQNGKKNAVRDSHNEVCHCSLKENGWMCLECKDEQNTSYLAESNRQQREGKQEDEIECFGLQCSQMINLSSPDRDRRRICLWCELPLKRSYARGDVYIYNRETKLRIQRTGDVDPSSQDIESYHKYRNQEMRMSRRELRGSQISQDDTPNLVRHLDTTNYRNFMGDNVCPSPEAVWKSKNGVWRYEIPFLLAIGDKCQNFQQAPRLVESVSASQLFQRTREDALPFARPNRLLYECISLKAAFLEPEIDIPESSDPSFEDDDNNNSNNGNDHNLDNLENDNNNADNSHNNKNNIDTNTDIDIDTSNERIKYLASIDVLQTQILNLCTRYCTNTVNTVNNTANANDSNKIRKGLRKIHSILTTQYETTIPLPILKSYITEWTQPFGSFRSSINNFNSINSINNSKFPRNSFVSSTYDPNSSYSWYGSPGGYKIEALKERHGLVCEVFKGLDLEGCDDDDDDDDDDYDDDYDDDDDDNNYSDDHDNDPDGDVEDDEDDNKNNKNDEELLTK